MEATNEPKPGTKDALKAENEALKAKLQAMEAEKEAQKDEQNAPTEALPAAAEDREDIFIPRGYANDEPNLFASVNGVSYLLPKGKTSKVPKAVADEIRRSWKAQAVADEHIEQMAAAAK